MTNLGLHKFALFVACCTLFLVFAGASVTSTESSLSVPDWPLSYGQILPEMKLHEIKRSVRIRAIGTQVQRSERDSAGRIGRRSGKVVEQRPLFVGISPSVVQVGWLRLAAPDGSGNLH